MTSAIPAEVTAISRETVLLMLETATSVEALAIYRRIALTLTREMVAEGTREEMMVATTVESQITLHVTVIKSPKSPAALTSRCVTDVTSLATLPESVPSLRTYATPALNQAMLLEIAL